MTNRIQLSPSLKVACRDANMEAGRPARREFQYSKCTGVVAVAVEIEAD